MSENYVSTDRKTENTYPETPRIIQQGLITMSPANFSAVTGGYSATRSVDISDVNNIGDLNRTGASASTLNFEVIHYFPATSEFSYFRKIPYVFFENYSTGQAKRNAYAEVINQHIGGVFNSTLYVTYFCSTNIGGERDDAFYSQYFIYKIWTTPFSTA